MTPAPRKLTTHVTRVRHLSTECIELSLDRSGLCLEAGRLITIHGRDATEDRSYTVCSGEQDESLEILYRLIPSGVLTPQLARLVPGDPVEISGPFGAFVLREPSQPFLFFATGTGVAPYRAYLRSHKPFQGVLVHGVRRTEDLVYRDEFAAHTYYPCVSQEEGTGFHGRITDFAATMEIDPAVQVYLCGANEMIFDMHKLLRERGVDDAHIFTEPYYYHSDD